MRVAETSGVGYRVLNQQTMAKHEQTFADTLKTLNVGDAAIFEEKDRNKIGALITYNKKELGIICKTSKIKGTKLVKVTRLK